MTDDEIRAALTEAMPDWTSPLNVADVVGALLPVVRRAQAAALRDAADGWPLRTMTVPAAEQHIRALADALDPTGATT